MPRYGRCRVYPDSSHKNSLTSPPIALNVARQRHICHVRARDRAALWRRRPKAKGLSQGREGDVSILFRRFS